MAGENMDEILSDDAEQSTTQQYEGDDIGALATAKQHITSPYAKTNRLLLPQKLMLLLLLIEYPTNPTNDTIISVVTVVTIFPK